MEDRPIKGTNIYYRKDGRWEGRYPIGRKPNGRLKYGYVYGKSFYAVQKKLSPLRDQAQRMMALYGKSLMTYHEWVDEWKKEIQRTIKTSTFSDYCYKLSRYLLPSIGQLPLYQISSECVQALIDDLVERQLSPNSIQIVICLLKKTLNDAKRHALIYKNPCDSVHLPKRQTKKIRALTRDQQKALMKAIDEGSDDKEKAAVLALNTGMRIGEVAALRWENVDFEKGILSIDQTCSRVQDTSDQRTIVRYDTVKSKSSQRIIPMNQKVQKLLKKLKETSISDFVFSVGTKGCEPRTLTYHFHHLRKKAKLGTIHFHQLRHTFATRCLEAKIGVASVSSLLGHASTKMTLDVYADSMLEERITAVYAIEKLGFG